MSKAATLKQLTSTLLKRIHPDRLPNNPTMSKLNTSACATVNSYATAVSEGKTEGMQGRIDKVRFFAGGGVKEVVVRFPTGQGVEEVALRGVERMIEVADGRRDPGQGGAGVQRELPSPSNNIIPGGVD